MRICPISSIKTGCCNNQRRISKKNEPIQTTEQTAFKGLKGAGIGAGAGLLYAGAVLGMCALGAPYLIPVLGTEAILGSAGVGAFAGHCIQEEFKDKK